MSYAQSFEQKIRAEQQRVEAFKDGFFDAKVSFIDSVWVMVKGEMYRIHEVIFPDSLKDYELKIIKEKFQNIEYNSINKNILVNEINSWLEFKSYFEAEYEITAIQKDSILHMIDLQVEFKNLYQSKVVSIEFKGNNRNSAQFLKRVSGLNIPGFITQNETDIAKIRLERSRYFSTVSNASFVRLDSGLVIQYKVVEQNPNRFDLILGYVPDNSGGGSIVGTMQLELMNILREGNQVALNYSRLEALRTRINAKVSQKYIAGLPLSAGIQFDLYQRDSTFQTKNWRLSSEYELNPYSAIGVSGRSESIGTGISNSQRVSNGNALFYGFSYELDFRNDLYVPTKGFYGKIGAEFGKKKNQIESDSSIYPRNETKQWFTMDFEWFNTLKGRHTLLLSGFASVLLSDFYQDSDLLRFGGSQSFRGYDEEQFGASKATWLNAEYRFLLDRTSFLFAFHTRGWTQSPTMKTEMGVITGYQKFLQSYGVGLAYRTRLGLLSFTYAKSPEDSFDNAKIHFSVRGNL